MALIDVLTEKGKNSFEEFIRNRSYCCGWKFSAADTEQFEKFQGVCPNAEQQPQAYRWYIHIAALTGSNASVAASATDAAAATNNNNNNNSLEALDARVTALERKRFECPNHVKAVDEQMRRARLAVEQRGAYSARWKFVPTDYYSYQLEQRAACLGASSIQQLCKALLMENRKAPSYDGSFDPTNPKYVLVVLQYAATLDANKKLINAIRALRPVKERLDSGQFDFQIASEKDNATFTGYAHNSVTPFGIHKHVRIVLASAIVPHGFFWMGGGHVHLKLGMAVTDFCRALDPVIVADISHPRTGVALQEDLE